MVVFVEFCDLLLGNFKTVKLHYAEGVKSCHSEQAACRYVTLLLLDSRNPSAL